MEQPYDDSIETLRQITGITKVELESEDSLITKVRVYKNYLNELAQSGASVEEINLFCEDVLSELNAECPYINQPVTVTGSLYYPSLSVDEDGSASIGFVKGDVKNAGLISKGFGARYENGELSIGYSFALAADTQQQEQAFGQYTFTPQGYAEIDELSVTYAHTKEEVITSLESLATDFIDAIDDALFNSTSLASSFQALSEIKPYELYRDIPTQVLYDAAIYIQETLKFDTQVPYEMELKGTFLRANATGSYDIHLPDTSKVDGGSKKIFGFIKGVEFTEDRRIVGNSCYVTEGPHFSLAITVVHDEQADSAVNDEIHVLMKDIVYCESLRELLRKS